MGQKFSLLTERLERSEFPHCPFTCIVVGLNSAHSTGWHALKGSPGTASVIFIQEKAVTLSSTEMARKYGILWCRISMITTLHKSKSKL